MIACVHCAHTFCMMIIAAIAALPVIGVLVKGMIKKKKKEKEDDGH